MKTFSKIPAADERSRLDRLSLLCLQQLFFRIGIPNRGDWVRCRNCGLILQNPQVLTEDVLERYDGEYFSYETENEDSFLNLMLLGLEDIGFFDWGEKGKDRTWRRRKLSGYRLCYRSIGLMAE